MPSIAWKTFLNLEDRQDQPDNHYEIFDKRLLSNSQSVALNLFTDMVRILGQTTKL